MANYLILLFSGAVCLVGAMAFVIWFVRPGLKVNRALTGAIRELREIEGADMPYTDLERLGAGVFVQKPYAGAWREFSESLNPQHADSGDDFGGRPVVQYRQTVPAEMYFTSDALVYEPMNAEFFKHFPGMLTAMGIVATFIGLIFGLGDFNPNVSPDELSGQVGSLVDHVRSAFFGSLAFIAVAVVVTAVEKNMINNRLKKQGQICEVLDHLFVAGVGEEYLSQLVEASQTSATRTGQLKDELVERLDEMIERQIQATVEAIRSSSDRQAASFATSISQALAEPMQQIAGAVSASTQDTGQQVHGLIVDVLKDFSTQMNDMFGSQISELTGLMSATSAKLEDVAGMFGNLTNSMETAGTSAVEAMAGQVEAALASMGSKQDELATSMASMLAELQDSASRHQAGFAESTQSMVSGMQENVHALVASTSSSIVNLEQTSEKLSGAMLDLETAARGMAATVAGVNGLGEDLRTASAQVTAALRQSADTASTYERASQAGGAAVAETQKLAATVKAEVGVYEGLVDGLKSAAISMAAIQVEIETYLEQVNRALTETHKSFAEKVGTTLASANRDFHSQLEQAVGTLSGAVKELGDTVEDLADARR